MSTAPVELRARAANALRWSLLGRLGVQLIRWSATLLVIRLLTPEDYGLMAVAMAIIAFATLFNELGANAVIVRNADLSRQEIGSIQGLVAVINLTLGGILFAAAPSIAALFDSDITAVLRGCCLIFPAFAVAIVQEALLIREMDFRSRVLVEAVAQVTGAIVALILAAIGAGVWALVVGMITTRAMMAIGFFRLVPHRFPWRLQWRDLQAHFIFAANVSLQRAASWIALHFTTIVLGALNSTAQLGLYNVGRDLAFLPLDKFGSVLNQVGFATYSRSRELDDGIRRALEKGLGYLIFLMTPYAVLGVVMAPEVIEILLGITWLAIVPIVQLMLIAMPFRAFNIQLAEAANAAGHAGLALRMHVTTSSLIAVLVITGSFWRIEGAAAGWAIAMPLTYIVNYLLLRSALNLRLGTLIAMHLRAFASAAAAAGCAWAVAWWWSVESTLGTLLVMLVVGGGTLLAGVFLIDRERLLDLVRFLQNGSSSRAEQRITKE